MQAQATAQTYDGYIENGAFYPRQSISRLPSQYVAVLTVIEVPATAPKQEESPIPWWEELEAMVRADTSPKLRMEDFPRMDFGREPINWDED